MVHSKEWATGSRLFGLLTLFRHFPGELVVHSTEWTTGSRLFRLLTQFRHFPGELVVHSLKWTTSSHLFLAFDLISALYPEELTDFLGF